MIDIKHELLKDARRIIPDMKETDGILNIDIGLLFNYSNQHIVSLGFGLLNDDILKKKATEDDSKYLFTDTKLNHRYNHKGYITLSRKIGKKISKTGYPIVAPINELNKYRSLIVCFGIKEQIITAFFPITVCLDKYHPIGILNCIIHDWENKNFINKFGIDITSGNLSQRYVVGHPQFRYNDNDITLQFHKTDRVDLIYCSPLIHIIGTPKKLWL